MTMVYERSTAGGEPFYDTGSFSKYPEDIPEFWRWEWGPDREKGKL